MQSIPRPPRHSNRLTLTATGPGLRAGLLPVLVILGMGLASFTGTAPGAAPGSKRVIVLDPGHGGEDSGVQTPAGSFEKDITLTFIGSLRSVLKEDPSLEVVLTRDEDQAMPLDGRAVMANRISPAAFLSVHCAYSHQASDRGFIIYYFQPDALQMEEFHSLKKEIGDRELRILPWALAQLPAVTASKELAGTLQSKLNGFQPGGSGSPVGERLQLLAMVKCPAVLLECAYLSNPEEEKKMMDPGYRDAYARRIREALLEFLQSSQSAWGGE